MENEEFPGENTNYVKIKCFRAQCQQVIYKPMSYKGRGQFCSNYCVDEYYIATVPGYVPRYRRRAA